MVDDLQLGWNLAWRKVAEYCEAGAYVTRALPAAAGAYDMMALTARKKITEKVSRTELKPEDYGVK